MRFPERLIDPASPTASAARGLRSATFSPRQCVSRFYAMMEAFRGACCIRRERHRHRGCRRHFHAAAIAIGLAVFLDGLDGRIARLTKTVSDSAAKWIRWPM
jgi:CDP-diacylglycerol--serine O-phosphatidyltransferase